MRQAVRDHARRRLEPGQQDRHLAHRARRLRRPAAAVQQRLPGRREHPGLALRGRGGRRRLRARLAQDHGGQPVPGDHGPGLLPPVRDRLQPRPARRGGRHQLGRALPRRRGDPAAAGRVEVGAAPTGKRVLVVGAGPVRALGRLPPRAGSATRSTIREAGPMAGGMMRFGIPQYRLPRDVLDAEVAADPRPGRRRSSSNTKVDGRRSTRCATGGFDAAFLAVGAHIGKRAYIPAGEAAHDPRRGLAAARAWRARSGRCSAAGSPSTAAATPRWTPPAPPSGSAPTDAIVVYRRTRDRMPAHDVEVEEAEEEGVLMKWLSTIKHVDGRQARARADGARRDRLPAADRRDSRSSRPTRSCSRSARRPTSRCSTACRGSRSRTASSQVGPNMMTGHPGIFAGGDMVPAERTVTVGVGHGKKAARNIDAWLRGGDVRAAARARAGRLRRRSTPGTTRTRRAPCSPQLEAGAPARSTFDEVVRRPRRVERALRGPPLHVVRQLLLLRQLLRRLPGQRGAQARRAGRALRDRPRLLQGLRPLRRRVPVRGDRDGARGDLTRSRH